MNIFQICSRGMRQSEFKVFVQSGHEWESSGTELSIRRPSLLIWADRLYSAGPLRSHLRPGAAATNTENSDDAVLKVNISDRYPNIQPYFWFDQINQHICFLFWPSFWVWNIWCQANYYYQGKKNPWSSDSIQSVRPRFILLLLLSHVGKRVKGPCYINKNILQQCFTRGCTRDSFTRVSLFVQVARGI